MGEDEILGSTERLCQDLYGDVDARSRMEKVFSERYTIEGGLRQGCILSPSLFLSFSWIWLKS